MELLLEPRRLHFGAPLRGLGVCFQVSQRRLGLAEPRGAAPTGRMMLVVHGGSCVLSLFNGAS